MRQFKYYVYFLSLFTLVACEQSDKGSIDVNGKTYLEGVDYQRLDERIYFDNSPMAGVVEFFWYGCPHCQKFEPELKVWLAELPENSRFVRIPAIWSKPMLLHARAYFTALELDMLDRLHEPLFVKIIALRGVSALDVQRQRIMELFQQYGIPKENFAKVFDSDSVSMKVNASLKLMRKAGISSTPSFLVNGKYVLTGTPFSSKEELLAVADGLMMREIDQQLVDWW